MENQSNIGARCLYPGEANMVVPFIFSDLPASVVLMTEEGPIRLTGLSRSVQPSPTQSNLVQPNPTMAPLPGKETGKETVKFLATLDDPTRHSLPDDLKTENVTMPFAPFNLFNSFNLFNRPPAIFPILPFCLLALSCPMFITGLGTAAPQQRFTQKECWDIFSASDLSRQLDSRSRAIVKKVLTGNNGIVSRHLVLDRVDEAFDVTPDILHARYVKHLRRRTPRLAPGCPQSRSRWPGMWRSLAQPDDRTRLARFRPQQTCPLHLRRSLQRRAFLRE